MFDFLIVGAGLFGSICARELTDKGYKCLVIDKRNHIGGNCYTENIDSIDVHKYGGHIVHTNDVEVWSYLNTYCEFNNYVNRVKVNYKNKIYSFPINLFTLSQIWNVTNPTEAKIILNAQKHKIVNPKNLEEWILSQIGKELYEIFIYGYTKKQWNTEPKNLPASIIKRLPIRLDFNDAYFKSKYQGIPVDGYTPLFTKLLEGSEIKLNTNWENYNYNTNKIIFTGRIDEYFNYKFGSLKYRSLRFEEEILNISDYQGNAVINYTDKNVPFTRILEHKHFNFGTQDNTVITKEYPSDKGEPFYPINDDINNNKYKLYLKESKKLSNVYFGGRLGTYRYLDMDEIVKNALLFCKTFN